MHTIKAGHVTASVALKRLVDFSAKNRFYRANRDLEYIFKTDGPNKACYRRERIQFLQRKQPGIDS